MAFERSPHYFPSDSPNAPPPHGSCTSRHSPMSSPVNLWWKFFPSVYTPPPSPFRDLYPFCKCLPFGISGEAACISSGPAGTRAVPCSFNGPNIFSPQAAFGFCFLALTCASIVYPSARSIAVLAYFVCNFSPLSLLFLLIAPHLVAPRLSPPLSVMRVLTGPIVSGDHFLYDHQCFPPNW